MKIGFKFILSAVLCFSVTSVFAQGVKLEAYVFAANNMGFLNEVNVTVLDGNKAYIGKAITNVEGFFEMQLPTGKKYEVTARKAGFEDAVVEVSTIGKKEGETVYSKIPMERAPGYILEVTMAELAEKNYDGPLEAITGALIEIYNNTEKKEELVLRDHPTHVFSYILEQGNSYTMMIRKKGFFTKRMELDVAVDGCILCMDGFGQVTPGVSDNLTQGHMAGTLAANIDLRKVKIDEPIEINNIFYDYGSSKIRSDAALELDKLVGVLKDNRNLIVELGSHTDARGTTNRNQELSEERAKAAVDYLVGQGIGRDVLKYKGYGESKIRNRCNNTNTDCTEKEHEYNRRTEFKVVGVSETDPYEKFSLRQIKEEERIMEEIMGLDDTIVEVPEGGLPEGLPEEDAPEEDDKGSAIMNDLTGGAETVPIPDDTDLQPPGEFLEEAIEEKVDEPDLDVKIERPGKINATDDYLMGENDIEVPTANKEVEVEEPEVAEVEDVKFEQTDDGLNLEKEGIIISKIQRTVKPLPEDYSGFKVLVLTTSETLPADHNIFKEFGDLTIEVVKPNEINYLVGDFKSGNQALNFMGSTISPRYPDATVLHFENGKRVD